ncbi:MAG TPA: hypothetical protein VKQ08_00220, partial [Cyclobacteriaceae bacterium]|nr:hypothetical protein [Cyclobacteriaceae bacterium]
SLNPQNGLIATLDNKWSYDINDYYTSEKNDFTKGNVIYPLDTLKSGQHHLSLSASDVYNNRSTASVDFFVSDGSGLIIGDFGNYPNPFNPSAQPTTFYFRHTRAGEDLTATLVIYDITGQPLSTTEYSVPASPYQVDLGEWAGETGGGIKLGSGIYVARLSVRSEADGSQNDRTTKLIILN